MTKLKPGMTKKPPFQAFLTYQIRLQANIYERKQLLKM